MKNLKSVLAVLVLVCLGTFAEAQNSGRPDPTGRGRYMQFGAEIKYPGAEILPEGTAGIQCNPAGEMVGATVWNTTQEGYAIKSVLTDKAQTAVVNGKTYLCHCAKGYNRLFLEQRDQPKESFSQTQERVIDPQGNVTVNTHLTLQLPLYEQRVAQAAPSSQYPTCPDITAKNYGQAGGCKYKSKTWKWVVGGVVLVGGGVLGYNHFKDKPGPPGSKTGPGKPFCTGVGCPKPGVGMNFSLGF